MQNSPVACIFSSCNDLSVDLARKLNSSGCSVLIVSDDSDWKDIKEGVTLVSWQGIDNANIKPSYVVCLSENFDVVVKASEIARSTGAKMLLVKSFVKFDPSSTEAFGEFERSHDLNVGILCVGSPVTTDVKLAKHFMFVDFLTRLNRNATVEVPKTLELFPLQLSKLSSKIVQKLFTMSAFGKRTAILGTKLSASQLKSVVKSIDTTFNICTTQSSKFFCEKVDDEEFAHENQRVNIENILIKPPIRIRAEESKFEIQKLVVSSKSAGDTHKDKQPRKTSRRKRCLVSGTLMALFLLVVVVVFFPILLLFTNYSMLRNAKRQFVVGDLEKARIQFVKAERMSSFSNFLLLSYSEIPLVSSITYSFDNLSNMFNGMSRAGITMLDIVDTSLFLMEKSSDDRIYDLQGTADQLTLDIDSLITEVGFLLSEIDNASDSYSKYLSNIVEYSQLVKISSDLQQARVIAKNLPTILGSEKPTSYLVVFQNNLRPRATGGIINSYAIVTFSSGRIVDVSVSSVGVSDKFFAGSIDPPKPLADYSSNERWLLRDSNWDVEFPKSAKQAAWFVEKEVGARVDGVVAIDVYLMDKFYKDFGGLEFGLKEEISQKMFSGEIGLEYPEEELMTESLVKFFDILFAFDETENLQMLSFIKNMFDQKHLMLTHLDAGVSGALTGLAMDGSIHTVDCEFNCYADLVGIVESDFSEGNIEIDREAELEVKLEEGIIKRKLTLKYTNENIERSYDYYVRFIGVGDSGFSDASVVGLEKDKVDMDLQGIGGRKEAGVYVQLLPGESKLIEVSWESKAVLDFRNIGRYNLLWFKQPGLEFPVNLIVSAPSGVVFAKSKVGLTEGEEFRYNTNPRRDELIKLRW